ncbi:hypothetical protein [Streptomyces noursei]|uniref:hypothetical protein n=1 Tax=Streptomyces noursei TaxID=1971 RepID=UPI0004352A15|nr:phosphoribosyltransferase [Streptomyces noursei PD-1]
MRGVWRELADLVLPVDCAGCGQPRTELCAACQRALWRGGRGAARVRPRPVPAGLPRVWAGAPYADEVRAVLLAHKERGALRLAAPLGAVLADGGTLGYAWAPPHLKGLTSFRFAGQGRGRRS